MRYWWVNQNQTYQQEFRGNFMWSPKTNANGARNQFYENMRHVSIGDVVFSFRERESQRWELSPVQPRLRRSLISAEPG